VIPGKTLSAESTLWAQCTRALQAELPEQAFNTWIRPLQAVDDGSVLRLLAPNRFVIDWVRQNYLGRIVERVDETGSDTGVVVEVGSRDVAPAVTTSNPARGSREPRSRPPVVSRLNPLFTFASFVEGKSNQLARAAASQVGENPGKSYNPLFIYGGVGLGKTHLLHAIYHAARANNFRALYVSAEQFTNEFVSAVREKSTDEFRRRFRNVDILLIDDIQFISGKEQTEESFFHTFNELHNANRQIVMTSDCSPKSMPRLGARLCSRFEWGLVADIKPPDFETRLAILRAKAEQEKTEVPPEVLEFIAQRIQQNIRELEGSLNRAVAYAKLFGAMLTPELAARAMQDISPSSDKTVVTPELVMKVVAERFQLTPTDLMGRKRDRATALARQVAMHLLKEAGNCSLAQIGLEFGNRDHTTVIHACRKIANDMDNDPYLRRQVLDIQKRLQHPPKARR